MKKEVGIAIKSNQRSNQLKAVTRPALATVITQSQMYAQTKHYLACLQDVIPTLAGIKYSYMQDTQAKDVLDRALLVLAFGFEL